MAVESGGIGVGSNLSINYNNGTANSPDDYFIALATEGERNVLPGDVNGDFIINANDPTAFAACLGKPANTSSCDGADLDGNGFVDCDDWNIVTMIWRESHAIPIFLFPLCVTMAPDDCNFDDIVNLNDFAVFSSCFSGEGGGVATGCFCVNADGDDDVDLVDFVVFQNAVIPPDMSP